MSFDHAFTVTLLHDISDGRRWTVRSCQGNATTLKRYTVNLRYTARLWTTRSDSAHAHQVDASQTTPSTLSGDAGCFCCDPRAPAPAPALPRAHTHPLARCPRLFHTSRHRSRQVTSLKMCGRLGDHNNSHVTNFRSRVAIALIVASIH